MTRWLYIIGLLLTASSTATAQPAPAAQPVGARLGSPGQLTVDNAGETSLAPTMDGGTGWFAPADTVRRDPDVALRRSLLAPGWGQIYNGDAYKLPFVWGGLAAFGGLAIYNEREYRRMQRVVRFAEFPERYPEHADDAAEYQPFIAAGRTASLIDLRDSFRRSRDLSVVRLGLWYALTAVDAYVSAHLSDFDADPDFRFTLAPTPDALHLNVVYRF